MLNELLQVIKSVARDQYDASKPSDVTFGTVISVSPLEINIDQRMTLPAEFFILTKAVLDHYVDITVSHVTEDRAGGGGYAEFAIHNHDYKGRKKILVHNGLKTGEKVILVQAQGGQKYVVLDRVFAHQASGEWL